MNAQSTANPPGIQQASAMFLETAEGLIERLARHDSPPAAAILERALLLAATFRSWPSERPTEIARVRAVQELVALNRRACEFLSRATLPYV